MAKFHGYILAIVAVALQWPSASTAAKFTMTDIPTFESMRNCAQICVTAPFGSLPVTLGCNYPYQNECVCRVDLAGVASNYLSSCVPSQCTVGPADADMSSMMSIYNSYCKSNGFDVTAAPAVATSASSSRNDGAFHRRKKRVVTKNYAATRGSLAN